MATILLTIGATAAFFIACYGALAYVTYFDNKEQERAASSEQFIRIRHCAETKKIKSKQN